MHLDQPLETHLALVLRAAEAQEASGVLEVVAGAHRTGIVLHEGVPVFADAGTVGETLGRVLLRSGRIDSDEYAAILRRMTEALVDDETMRFGEVAVELGILDPLEVSEALRKQVREKIVGCLQLERADWTFRADPDAAARVARYPAPVSAVLSDAILAPGESRAWFDRMQRYTHLYPQLRIDSRGSMPGLTPARLRFLRMLDGTRSAGMVILAASTQLEDAPGLLAMLTLLGRVELRDAPLVRTIPPAPEPPAPARETPARTTDAADLAAKLRADLGRGRAAPAPQEHRTRLSAEDSFEKGRRCLTQGRLAAALPLLQAAAEAMPGAREYALYHRFTQYLSTEEVQLRKALLVELEALVLEVLGEDRRCAFAHYVQGRLAAVEGDDASALRCFRIAAQLDPHDVEAQRWYRVISSRAR